MYDTVWAELALWQILLVGVCFIWSGFVRSGLGFGGAALTLPLLLMIHNDPLLFLPAICWQLLFFSLLTVSTHWANVNWAHIKHICVRIALPFAAGLFGLLNLSGQTVTLFVYIVTLAYGIVYVLNRVMVSRGKIMDWLCLVGGGYVSGVSLIGAPLIVAYSTRHLAASQLRDTLFVMWILFVVAKLSAFSLAGVDLQWQLSLLTLPLVGLGHWLGLKLHQRMVAGEQKRFHQVIGLGLVAISIVGLGAAL